MRFDGALFASNFEFIQWSIVNEIAKRIVENSKSVFFTDDFLCRPITAQTTGFLP